MSWIEIDEGVYAEEATPDPIRVLGVEELTEIIENKQREVTMYENEITHLTERKDAFILEVAELEALIGV